MRKKLSTIMTCKEYLSSKSKLNKSNGCIEWIYSCDSKGYGLCNYYKKNQKAHRVAYKVFKGDIPNGLLVCHKCDNPNCINPDHLFLGTVYDNNLDCILKGRAGSKRYFNVVEKLRKEYKKGVRGFGAKSLAKKYKLNKSSVRDIVLYKSYKYEN